MSRPSSTRARSLLILTALVLSLAVLSLKTHRAFTMGAGSAAARQTADVATSGEVRLHDGATVARASALSSFLLDPSHQGWALLGQPLNASFGLTPLVPVGPVISATKNAALAAGGDVNSNGFVNPGDTLLYSVVVSNTGSDASNVSFTDILNADLTLVGGSVTASPVAVDDSYTCTGNLSIAIAAGSGVLANDYMGLNPTATITAFDATSTNGGTVALAGNGSFTYEPAAGFTGTDTFHYTLSNSTGSSIGTVSIVVTNRIWFINNAAASCTTAAAGCGRFSHPYSSLSSFITANPDASSDRIFIYQGSGSYAGALTLKSSERLIGQGDALNSTTLGFTPDANTNVTLPGATAKPTLTGTLTLATGVTVLAIDLSTGASTGMTGSGGLSGLTVGDSSPTVTNGLTVTTSTGTAVSLNNVGGTFTFRSITANGAGNGISLTTTTGSFTVVGDGTDTSLGGNSSGGTISNATGADSATTGIGVYMNNVQSVTLRRMTINGTNQNFAVRGFTVNGFTMEYSTISGTNGTNASLDEAAMAFDGLTGSASVKSTTIQGSVEDTFRVLNTSGTLNRLTVDTVTFGTQNAATGNDGLALLAQGTAVLNATVQNCTFNFAVGDHFNIDLQSTAHSDLIFQNNTISNPTSNTAVSGGGGITLSGGTAGSNLVFTYDVNNNTFSNTRGDAILVAFQTVGADGSMSGTIRHNTIGIAANDKSGSSEASGIEVRTAGASGDQSLTIFQNTIRQYSNFGILLQTGANPSGPWGAFNITVDGNTISNPSSFGFIKNGIQLNAGTNIGDAWQHCIDIKNNTTAGSGDNGGTDMRLRQRHSTTVRLPGYGGTATDTAAVASYLVARNTSGTASASVETVAPVGGGFVGGAACGTPAAAFASPIGDSRTKPLIAAQDHRGKSGGVIKNGQAMRPALAAFPEPMSYLSSSTQWKDAKTARADQAVKKNLSVSRAGVASPSAPFSGETVSVTGINTLPTNKSVTITFKATIAAGFTGTSIPNQASISGSNFTTVLSNNLSTDVIQAPTIGKAFNPTAIATNTATSTLTFTVTNPNPNQALSGIAFSDTFPSGLEVDATPTLSNGCSGTFTPALAAGQTSISYSGGSVGAGAGTTCTVSFKVKGTTDGAKANTTGAITATQTNTGVASNTATLNVINAPTFNKSFTPNSIPINTTSTLSFTITNNSPNFPLTSVGFNDALPAGVEVAGTPNITGTCFGGTITANAAATSISLSGATLGVTGGGSNSCTFSVDVKGTTAGSKSNSVNLATNELGATSATANATLLVVAPPTISKAFSPTSIFVNGTFSQLTFTIHNPNSSGTLTGVGFSDPLPSGLQVDSTPGVTVTSCGGSVNTSSFTAGATTLNVSNAAVAVGTDCTIRVNIIGTTAGAKNNTTGAITSTEGGTNNGASGTASATLNVFTAPQIAKSFGASFIPVGGTTTVTFTITNPAANPGALTTITFIDSLPSGMVVVNPPVPTNTCSGSVTAVNGSGTISLGGASIATPGNTCQVQATVMATTAGVKNNSVTVSSGNGGTGNTAMASITVANPPTVSKAFSPALITPGGTSTLTITLTNPNASIDLTGAALTDTLPSGVTTVGGTAATTCNGSATQDPNSVSLSGGTIPQGSNCTLSVNVTSATNNTYTNTIAAGALTTNAGSNANPASANLIVASPPTISKAFSPGQITPGGTSTLTITLTNPNSNVPLTLSSALTDTLPANVTTVNSTAQTTCSGGTASQMTGSVTLTGGTIPVSSSCTLKVDVTSSVGGVYTNTIAAGALQTNGGSNAAQATADLIVALPPALGKSFTPSQIKVGETSTLQFTITNSNAFTINNLAFTDDLPTGVTVADSGPTSTCGGGMLSTTSSNNRITFTGGSVGANTNCQFNVTVTGATFGKKDNTTSTITSSNAGTGAAATASLIVVGAPTIAKSFGRTGAATIQGSPNGATESGNTVTIMTTAAHGFVIGQSVTIAGVALSGYNGNFTITGIPTSASFTYTNATTLLTPSGGGSATTSSGVTSASIQTGMTTTMSFVITNPNTVASGVTLNNISFSDTLPAGFTVASNSPGVATCNGGTLLTTSPSTVAFTGGVLAPTASCTIDVTVTAAQVGSGNNTTTAISATESGPGATSNTATLLVLARPTVAKAFNSAQIQPGGTSTLTITLSNSNGVPLTGAAVTDTLPANVTTVNSTAMTTCGGTAGQTSGTVSLVNGTIPAGGNCTLTINVTSSTQGTQTNTIPVGGVTTNNGGSNTVAASADLTVLFAPTITKSFTPATIQSGGTSTVTVIISNSNAQMLPGAAFSDTLAHMKAKGGTVTNTCGTITPSSLNANDTNLNFGNITLPANGSCTITFDVTSTEPGVWPNQTSGVTTTQTPVAGAASSPVNLTVLAAPTIGKSFSPSTIQAGGPSTVTLTLNNSNTTMALNNASFTDTLTNMSAAGGAVTNTCGAITPSSLSAGATNLSFSGITIPQNGSCTVTFGVKSSTGGVQPNTTSGVTTTQTPVAGSASNTATLTVIAPPTISKAFSPALIPLSGVSTVTLTLSNSNASMLTNAAFTDTLTNMSAVGGAVGGTCTGTTPSSLSAGATALSFSGITIPASGSCTVTFNVTSSTPGSQPNTTSGVTTAQTPTAGSPSNTATLIVNLSVNLKGDFDGDGKTDLGIWRPSTATFLIYSPANNTTMTKQLGVSTDVPVVADYDGDGKTDFAVWRPSTGTWIIFQSSTGTTVTGQWGNSTDIPVPGDYDGDGRADLAVWRPSTGTWFIFKSSGGTMTIQWGTPGDVPVPGDYDGDGWTDLGIWRPSTATFWIYSPANNTTTTKQWGVSTDVPVPADYDGDHKTDIAVWRPSTGAWIIFQSSNGQTPNLQWGLPTDIPVPGDYDGDGKADLGVWRPSTGVWFIFKSTGGTLTIQWGTPGDVPIT